MPRSSGLGMKERLDPRAAKGEGGTLRRALSLLPPLLLFLSFAVGDGISLSFALLFAVLLHEGGHGAAFFLLGAGVPGLAGARGGFLLTGARPLSPREEALVAAAGPLANLLAAAGFLLLTALSAAKEWCFCVFAIQLLTALSNLLPLESTDGGRLLSLLSGALFGERGRRGCRLFFHLLAALLFFGGGYLYRAGRVGLSLPVFGAYSLLRATEGAQGRRSIRENTGEFPRFPPENRDFCGLNGKNTEK